MMVEGDGEIRLVLNRAAAAARRTGSTEIQPGHLLLGIVDLPGSRGAVLLEELGLDIDQVRRALGLSMDLETLGMRPPSLSAASVEALQLADAEASRAGAADAGSDDLVLALAQVGGSLVASILESLGLTEAVIRRAIARLRGEGPEAERMAEDESG